jgi:hypothetical protein
MAYIDIFNGDADGICSLIQLRLAEPQNSQLVTGVKREINLLKGVDASSGDKLTVLDISMQKNQEDLSRLLGSGASVFYADHHQPGEIPDHPNLSAYIDTSPTMCSALIVDEYLGGQFHLWAITAAYGDNLTKVAHGLAKQHGLNEEQTALLQELGLYLNYNGYGASTDDLFYHPADLFKECVQFASPFEFIEQNAVVFTTLKQGYTQDMALASNEGLFHETEALAALILPDLPWARRVSGVYSNQLSNEHPERAHVILTKKSDGGYLVSIRAPQTQLEGADDIASQFKTGGGRKGAAGINALPESDLQRLIGLMQQRYERDS